MCKYLGVVILCLFCQLSAAQSRQNAKAHTHGFAEMTVVYETQQLIMELQTPAANMLGFERSPQSADEWQQIKKLRQILSAPEKTVTLTPACTAASVEVEIPFAEEKDKKHQAEITSPDKQLHSHEHEEHDAHGHETQAHQDIHTVYQWHCDGKTPPAINIHLFDLFSGFQEIRVQWIASGKQGAGTLNKNNATLEIKP